MLRKLLTLIVAAALSTASYFVLTSTPVRAGFNDQAVWGGTSTGSANAQVVAIPNVTSMGDFVGVKISFIVGFSNTGSTTLAIGGLTATTVKQTSASGLTALVGGELVAGNVESAIYDGTEWILLVPAGGAGAWSLSSPVYNGTDTGSPNAITATMSPALSAYSAGAVYIVKVGAGNANTGPATAALSGMAAKAVVHVDETALLPGDYVAGQELILVYDGTNLQLVSYLASTPKALTANVSYYVNASTGSDSNNGLTSGTAWATLQHAANVLSVYQFNGFTVTVNVANGAYGPVALNTIGGEGLINWVGNSGSPSSVTITGTTTSAIYSKINANFTGFELISLGGTNNVDPGAGLFCVACTASLTNITFGAVQGSMVYATNNGAQVTLLGTITLTHSTGTVYSGSNGAVFEAHVGATITDYAASPPTINISSAISVVSFVNATLAATMNFSVVSFTNPGNVTGTRYFCSLNAVIYTGGAGGSFFPGTVAGTGGTGCQYY